MSSNLRKICPVCAWRADCAKRFSMSGDETLHCPDYTEDITLREKPDNTESESDGQG